MRIPHSFLYVARGADGGDAAQQDAQRATFIVERAKQEREQIIVKSQGEALSAQMISAHKLLCYFMVFYCGFVCVLWSFYGCLVHFWPFLVIFSHFCQFHLFFFAFLVSFCPTFHLIFRFSLTLHTSVRPSRITPASSSSAASKPPARSP